MKIHLGIFRPFCLMMLFLSQAAILQAYVNEKAVRNNHGVSFPTQAQLGNVFVAGEKVRIQVTIANGTSVDWVVTDFEDRKVASGTTGIVDGKATIEPEAKSPGFYLMTITAKADGVGHGEGITSYAVIPRLDNSKMAGARFGVASHFGKSMTTDLAPLLAKAGVVNARDSMDWTWIESVPGKFDFTVHNFDTRVADLDKNHINILFNIVFGNPIHYDNTKIQAYCAAPHTREQYAAYTRLCIEHLRKFGPLVKTMEIWNEYNGSFCAGAAENDRPRYYTEMLKDAYAAIKQKRPDVVVLGGAMSGIPLPYAEKLFINGALDYMDGIVIHQYGGSIASVETGIRQLVDLMKKYNKGRAKPIWVTEFGDWDDHSVKRAEAAGRLTKMYAMLLNQSEVAGAYWYLARDYEEFPTMGLVHAEADPMGKYTPAATYAAFATMASQLFNAQPKGREPSDLRTDIRHFERNGQGIWVCWSNSQTASLVFKTQRSLRRINVVGGSRDIPSVKGEVIVKVDDQPVYLIADKASDVASVCEVPRADQIVADAAAGFSDQQGQNGWSYHTYTSNEDGTAPYQADRVQPMNYTILPGDWGYAWSGPGEWYHISADQTQPSAANGTQRWTVRRWTSTVDGNLHLVGEVTRGENGDGVDCKIFVSGQQVYTKRIPPKGNEKIDVKIVVERGSQVDFAVTPGPKNDPSFDACGFNMTILTSPK